MAKVVVIQDLHDQRAKHNMVLEGMRDILFWVLDENTPDSSLDEYFKVLSVSGRGIEFVDEGDLQELQEADQQQGDTIRGS